MTTDTLTVLHALEGRKLTKIVRQQQDGGFAAQAYDRADFFSVEQVPVGDIIELGRVLDRITLDPQLAVIRSAPLPGTNLRRCRRLKYDQVEEDGSITARTFTAAPRSWLALDLDGLPLPSWNPEYLANRQAAIARDRVLHPVAALPPKGPSAGEDYDLAADADPAPIDHNDWGILIRAAISYLPPEFEPAHAWFQFTSGHGIKPGSRLRLWYWLDRPVSDREAKRWLADSPVDAALFNEIQVHYVAAPIFPDPAPDPDADPNAPLDWSQEPPSADPIARRSGFWWRTAAAVAVPDLPEPPPPPPPPPVEARPFSPTRQDALGRRARAYADTVLANLASTPAGDRHPALRQAAIRLYSLSDAGLLEPADVTSRLRGVAAAMAWPERRLADLLDWARAAATAQPALPEGFA